MPTGVGVICVCCTSGPAGSPAFSWSFQEPCKVGPHLSPFPEGATELLGGRGTHLRLFSQSVAEPGWKSESLRQRS